MKLPSGKEISDKVLRNIADDWVTLAFQEEHVVDLEGSFAEELEMGSYSTEGESYNEADIKAIFEAVEDVVIDIVIKLKERYSELYTGFIADKHWE